MTFLKTIRIIAMFVAPVATNLVASGAEPFSPKTAASFRQTGDSDATAEDTLETNPYLILMRKAAAHAREHGAPVPVLSPIDRSVIPDGYRPFHTCITPPSKPANGEKLELVPVKELQAQGIRIVPWTTNDPEMMRVFIQRGVDGLITDRPDLLQQVLAEERTKADAATLQRLSTFDVDAHRGGCGLRPENTLPSFESGLDELITTIETDTGVSTDHISTIWHDQYYSPEACRRVDGKPYTFADRIYLSDISSREAQKILICDKLPFGEPQSNDLALSPVSVAFARQEHLDSPYVPTNLDQLFRFVRFYSRFYRSGPGKLHPEAAKRAANADKVRFNIEIKNYPENTEPMRLRLGAILGVYIAPEMLKNHSAETKLFVKTLTNTIKRYGMAKRSEIQSINYYALQMVEEMHSGIPTYYLSTDAYLFRTTFVPEQLRLAPKK